MRRVIFIILILIFVIGCSISLSGFKKGYAEIKSVDEKYGFSLEEYPLNFTKITLTTPTDMETATFMQRDFEELRGKFNTENRNEALLTFLDFRIALLNAEIYYKLKLSGGKAGDVKDGFGCKHKQYVLDSANYGNTSAQFGYAAVNHLSIFLESYPKEASLTGVSGAWPLFLNESFKQIEKDARTAKALMNRLC